MTPRRVLRFAHKELRETLRDRRTVTTLVLMPILLYPLLGVVFRQFFLINLADTAPVYRFGVGSERDGQLLEQLLRLGDWSPRPLRPASKLGPLVADSEPQVEMFVTNDLHRA